MTRLWGLDTLKASIAAGIAVAQILQTSLGPKGMDKMLQSPDGDIFIGISQPDVKELPTKNMMDRWMKNECELDEAPDGKKSADISCASADKLKKGLPLA